MVKAMAGKVENDNTQDEDDSDDTGDLYPAWCFLRVFQHHSDRNSYTCKVAGLTAFRHDGTGERLCKSCDPYSAGSMGIWISRSSW